MTTAAPDPLRITALGPTAAATVAFRSGGRLRIAVIVKATFALVPDGPMTLAEPAPIVRADVPHGGDPRRSVAVGAETAPYLARTDVMVLGRAMAPGGRPVPQLAVRLMLARDGRPLLDKRLLVTGPRNATGHIVRIAELPLTYEHAAAGPAAENPVGSADPSRPLIIYPAHPGHPAGFGPLARSWPVRRRILGAFDPRYLDAPIAVLPDGFPWAYFQAAPPDQQTVALRGDEWLVLEGFHADLPRLASQLPSARGVARLYGPSGNLAAGIPVALVGDTMSIDADRRTCAVLWRGNFEVAGEESLATLQVVAGVELPGRAVAFEAPRAAAPAAKSSVPGTKPMSPLRPVLPFKPASSESPPLRERSESRDGRGVRSGSMSTKAFNVSDFAWISGPVLPFAGKRPAAPPEVPAAVSLFVAEPPAAWAPAAGLLPDTAHYRPPEVVAVEEPFTSPPLPEVEHAGGAASPAPAEEPIQAGPIAASFLAAAARAGLAEAAAPSGHSPLTR